METTPNSRSNINLYVQRCDSCYRTLEVSQIEDKEIYESQKQKEVNFLKLQNTIFAKVFICRIKHSVIPYAFHIKRPYQRVSKNRA